MIELIVLNYLTETLDVNVYMEEQEEPESSYIIIEKTSGGETNFIKNAVIAIQSYGSSKYEAATLNESVKDAMRDIITLDTVSSCKLNSDYDYTDTTKKKYRYQAVFDLVYF